MSDITFALMIPKFSRALFQLSLLGISLTKVSSYFSSRGCDGLADFLFLGRLARVGLESFHGIHVSTLDE
jgi:hypothetical protein